MLVVAVVMVIVGEGGGGGGDGGSGGGGSGGTLQHLSLKIQKPPLNTNLVTQTLNQSLPLPPSPSTLPPPSTHPATLPLKQHVTASRD